MTRATLPPTTPRPSLEAIIEERDRLRGPLEARALAWLAGSSRRSTELRDEVTRVAHAGEGTVLLVGPPGSGKELVALAVHALSPRRAAPFRLVRCEPAPRHEPLAHPHLDGGTLHLAGVERLAPARQREAEHLLSTLAPDIGKETAPPLRVVASTAADLERLCDLGRFDDGLAYRLNVMSVVVPALAERADDLPTLAAAFCAAAGGRGALDAARLPDPSVSGWRELWAATQGGAHPPSAPAHTASTGRSLRAREAAWIRQVLAEEGGNRSRTARVLGINRSTLYKKLCDYGLE